MYFHPKINPFLLYEMMSKNEFQPVFEDLISKNLIYIFEKNKQYVGMFKLVPLTYRASHIAYLGGVAIHPNFIGQGLGYEMMLEILKFSKEKKFIRIELSTSVNNKTAIQLYEKVGFKREGILKKYTFLKSENIFLDEIIMAFIWA